ncbi:MAG: type III pantothenate kinase [Planctomycetes bacterium]|nr:type III pantothenate kinase [Planctomycetota bacterium]
MSANFLTLDLGNSRCKLRRWRLAPGRAPELAAADELATGEGLPDEFELWLARAGELAGAALCSVADPALEVRLVHTLATRLGERSRGVPDPGLQIACRAPERVGRDRLFAARGALARLGRSCLVLDAGTALTVDALHVEPGARAQFLGGAIAPGPALLARALALGTARLPEIEPRPAARALGRDTHEALESGVAVGFAGAARELVARIGAEAGLETAPVCLTGGARAFLQEAGLFGAREVHVEPELVHLGLLAASGALA